MDDRTAFLLDGDGGRCASKALAQRGGPKLDRFGSVFELSDFDTAAAGGDGRNDVLLRGPVDRCKCSEDRFGRTGRKRRHEKPPFRNELAWFRRKSYSGRGIRFLSIRFRSQALPAAGRDSTKASAPRQRNSWRRGARFSPVIANCGAEVIAAPSNGARSRNNRLFNRSSWENYKTKSALCSPGSQESKARVEISLFPTIFTI